MTKKSRLFNLLAISALVAMPGAYAQGLQNWQTNQMNQINQDASAGLINQNQASHLDAREAQIQAQEQMYRSQNGGYLTPQEQGQIKSELSSVGRGFRHDMQRDGTMNAATGAGVPAQWASTNGYVPSQWAGGYPQSGLQNVNGMAVPNGYVPQNINGYPQNQNGYQGMHHHHMFNQYGVMNGGNGGYVPQLSRY